MHNDNFLFLYIRTHLYKIHRIRRFFRIIECFAIIFHSPKNDIIVINNTRIQRYLNVKFI